MTIRALVVLLICLSLIVPAIGLAQDKPRYGGILNWFDYGDPGRLDVHAESPLVDGKLVVLTPGGNKGTMAALDKMTGAPVWQSADIVEGAQYSSVVPATINGKKQYVQLVMQTLFGVDAETGKVIWRTPWSGKTAVIPSPIVKGDEVFVTSGYQAGSMKVKISGSEATTSRNAAASSPVEKRRGWSWRSCSSIRRTFSCSTSRATTSTSAPRRCCSRRWRTMPARCCSCPTIVTSWARSRIACSSSTAGECRRFRAAIPNTSS